jgi:hypothetical protein
VEEKENKTEGKKKKGKAEREETSTRKFCIYPEVEEAYIQGTKLNLNINKEK